MVSSSHYSLWENLILRFHLSPIFLLTLKGLTQGVQQPLPVSWLYLCAVPLEALTEVEQIQTPESVLPHIPLKVSVVSVD